MSRTKINPGQLLDPVSVLAYGWSSSASAATNRAALDAAKAAVTTAGVANLKPITIPSGVFAFDNTTPFDMIAGLVIRGTSKAGDTTKGTVLTLNTAGAAFSCSGDYLSAWELSGVTLDFASVAGSQANPACVGVLIAGGTVQGPSQFLAKNVTVNAPYIGFKDISPVSYMYVVEDFQVINPGEKGFLIGENVVGHYGGTSKKIVRPVVNGSTATGGGSVAGNNDGIYAYGQGNGLNIYDSVMDSLKGRHLYFVSSTVRVFGGYHEHVPAVPSTGNVMVFDTSDVLIDGLIDYGATMHAAGSAVILVQGATNLKLNNYYQLGQGIDAAVAVYGLRVDPATASAAKVTITGSPSIRTKMQVNSGSEIIISDTVGAVKVVEPMHRALAPVSTINAAGDQTLISYTVPGSTVNAGGAIRVRAAGTITGAGGSKNIALYFGAKYWVIKSAVGTENWSIDVVISGRGTETTHKIMGTSWVASTPTAIYEEWATEDFNDNLVLKCVGNVAVGTDVITQTLLEVETL